MALGSHIIFRERSGPSGVDRSYMMSVYATVIIAFLACRADTAGNEIVADNVIPDFNFCYR